MQFYAKPLLLRKQKNKRHGVIKFLFLLVLLHLLFIFITSCTTTNQRNNSSSPIEIKTGDTATGTGILFSSSDYVITSCHVIQGAKSINVRSVKGEKIDATIAVKDIAHDIDKPLNHAPESLISVRLDPLTQFNERNE